MGDEWMNNIVIEYIEKQIFKKIRMELFLGDFKT